ncbi:MAG: hypothetical protein AB7E81_24295 [Hyphomicrobiaceae bacterium]
MRYLGIEVDDAIEIAEEIDILSVFEAAPIPDMVSGASRVTDYGGTDDRNWDSSSTGSVPLS